MDGTNLFIMIIVATEDDPHHHDNNDDDRGCGSRLFGWPVEMDVVVGAR